MADIKISALAAAAALGGAEKLAGVQAGANVAVTPAQIAAYLLGQPGFAEGVRDAVAAQIAAGPGIALDHDDEAGTLTIGNSGALQHPGYRSGFWYGYPITTAAGTAAITADTLTAIPISIGLGFTAAAMAARISTAVAGSFKVGIYSNDRGPRAKLAEGAAAASTGASGVSEIALAANVALPPGWYWLASIANAAPTMYVMSNNDQAFKAPIGSEVANTLLTGSVKGVQRTDPVTYAGTGLPDDFGAWATASVSVPALVLKAA